MITIAPTLKKVKKISGSAKKQATTFVNRRPLLSFIIFLVALVGLIALGNQLRQPSTETAESQPVVKPVQVFAAEESPTVKVQAQVEKSGVIKLVAQTGGVVQKIRVEEGDHVNRGTQLFSLSTNYQGGNAMSVSRQISQRSYQFQLDTFDAQKESIAKSRDLANKGETQAAELRDIARKSIDDTKSLISLNEEILTSLDQQIAISVEPQTTQLKSTKAQVLAALNGLRSGLRSTEYLNSEDQEAAEIGRLTRDNTLKQLEIQEKSLELNRDLAQLNLRLAQINEAMMYPASPCPGVVERIYVQVGQNVSPGTVLATIKGDANTAAAVAMVSPEIARSVSTLGESVTLINGERVVVTNRYVSQEATDGSLHSIQFSIPDAFADLVSNTSFLTIEIPVGVQLTGSGYVFAPLDAVYQGQTSAYVYVVGEQDGELVATSRSVTLGRVFGNFVEIIEGLSPTDKVILNRNVIEGDRVSIH